MLIADACKWCTLSMLYFSSVMGNVVPLVEKNTLETHRSARRQSRPFKSVALCDPTGFNFKMFEKCIEFYASRLRGLTPGLIQARSIRVGAGLASTLRTGEIYEGPVEM